MPEARPEYLDEAAWHLHPIPHPNGQDHHVRIIHLECPDCQ